MKFYAVKVGRITGIYYNWDDCKKQVDGYPNAKYKSFDNEKDAKAFLAGEEITSLQVKNPAIKPTNASISVFTDGGSRNTGNIKGGQVKATDKAAWAFLIKTATDEISGSAGEFGATNNKMEITALIEAMKKLRTLKLNDQEIVFVLDSKYVLDAINQKWIYGWAKRGFTRREGELKNKELWQEVYRLLPQFKKAKFVWTKGHADNAGNQFVDSLLNKTMDQM